MSAQSVKPAWVEQLELELERGRHVLLHGNVGDQYAMGDRIVGLRELLAGLLSATGSEIVGFHDVADGFTFADAAHGDRFDALYRERVGHAHGTGDRPQTTRGPPPQPGDGPGRGRPRSRRYPATASLSAVRAMVAQDRVHVAFVLDLAEATMPGAAEPQPEQLESYAILAHAVREAVFLPRLGRAVLTGRNTIVLVTAHPSPLLSRLVDAEPQVARVEVGTPGTAERRAVLMQTGPHFHAAHTLSRDDLARHVETLVRLTEGYRTWDLEALRRTSLSELTPLDDPRRLTARFVLGRRRSPWDETAADLFTDARERLRSRVMGQDAVIDAVCRRLMVARYGVGFEDESGRRERRPRATFFFAGPTGVGKTELAKALAWLLFGDEAALISFDMTEYRDPASAGRLVGSDPGYVGFEQGGQLTNAVLARPYSVLLFDEAEKAEPRVLDVFIQILDEGRLTDGRGRTVSFGDTIVIFTSNAGAATFAERRGSGPAPTPAEVRKHFENAVQQRLSLPEPLGINRPELYGRLGDGVLGFDMLRPAVLRDIVTKFTARWRHNARRQYGVTIDIDIDALTAVVEARLGDDGMVSGARSLHTHLSALLDEQLAQAASRGLLVADEQFAVLVDARALSTRLRRAEP